jgi:hypothetical protein
VSLSYYIDATDPIRVREDGLNIALCVGRGVVPDYLHMSRCQAEALRAQLNRIFNPEAMSTLDHAVRVVDALGGPDAHPDYDAALDDVQAELQRLGARKPSMLSAVQTQEIAA